MRASHRLGLLAFGFAIPAAAQTSCTPDALTSTARTVAAVRHKLHEQSVPENDPNVPAQVAAQLGQLKQALASSAEAVFACANGSASPEALQKQLADALHADVASATGTVETRGKRDYGAYGSDLSVQVFQLFGRPKFVEVDFRYGVECGDDNLLMVFEAADDNASSPWHENLNWSAPTYTKVGDALGDFAMLTPLTGSYKSPSWRFLVAHGHPGCGAGRDSHFDLDLLSPTADPAKPKLDWHFERAYTEDHVVARLDTTEDSVEFRIQHEGKAGKGGTSANPVETFRFHLAANGQLEPVSAAANGGSAGTPAAAEATTNSPQ